MELQKRVRTELRDLIAQKKIEQEAYSVLITEVNNLREERKFLLGSIQSEKDTHQQFLSTFKQEVDFLFKKKATIETQLFKLKENISEASIAQTDMVLKLAELDKQHIKLQNTLIESKNEAREALDTLEQIKFTLQEHQVKENELNTTLKFINGKSLQAEEENQKLQNKIKKENALLQSIIKEQSRYSNWDEYLQAKENFLIEQFKLLGVKYVVYNSR